MNAFLAAVRFLTIVRAPGGDVAPGRAAACFPTVGAVLGLAGAGVFLLARQALPASIAALLTVGFWTLISGMLHEDGVADVADALRAGRSREHMLAILKDSRIGAFGAVALLLSVLARWQALQASCVFMLASSHCSTSARLILPSPQDALVQSLLHSVVSPPPSHSSPANMFLWPSPQRERLHFTAPAPMPLQAAVSFSESHSSPAPVLMKPSPHAVNLQFRLQPAVPPGTSHSSPAALLA